MIELLSKGNKHSALKVVVSIACCLTAQTVGIVAVPCAQATPAITATAQQERTVEKLLDQVDALFDKKKYKEAEPLLIEAASFDVSSNSSAVHRMLATVFLRCGDLTRCTKECSRALEFKNPDTRIGFPVGASYGGLGRAGEGIRLMRSFAKDQGTKWRDEANMWQARGLLVAAAGMAEIEKYDQCAELAIASIGLWDKEPLAHLLLAGAYLESGEPEDAIAQALKAKKMDPNMDVSYVLGSAYMCAGQYDEAISVLNESLVKEKEPKKQQRYKDWIQDLKDDKAKVSRGRPSTSDYFNELKAQDHVYVWQEYRLPIRVFFAPADGVKGYRPALRRIFLQSLDEWCEASNNKLAFKLVTDKGDADLVVEWTDKALPYGSGRKGKEAAGITHFEGIRDNKISRVRIVLETYNNDHKQQRSNRSMRETCLHEIGHALGLGHSGYVRDVMFYSSNNKRLLCLSHRDKATIQRFYKDYPNIEHTKLAVRGRNLQVLPDECFAEPRPGLLSRAENVALIFYSPSSSSGSKSGSRAKSVDDIFFSPAPPVESSTQSKGASLMRSKVPSSTKSKKADLFSLPTKPK